MDMPIIGETRFAVGVFAETGPLYLAYRELIAYGLTDGEICLMASRSVVKESLARQRLEGVRSSESDRLLAGLQPSGAHSAGGSVYASVGNLCDCLGGAADPDHRGQWVSDLLGRWISKRAAQYFEDRLGEGKILVWVMLGRRVNSERENLACTTLLQHASESVRVLDFALRN